jgi:3-methyladenine DNA glycosylase AlkC
MADRLVAQYGLDIPLRIASAVTEAFPPFNTKQFIADCSEGYDALGLMDRGKRIALALRQHLPADYAEALEILMQSLDHKEPWVAGSGMASFFYLPHVCFVADYGLEHFEASMQAQHELTQRFTAEFSIRNYLEKHPEQTLARLEVWASDPSLHVRRLVSEGTRPRLPWAKRLPQFQKDPAPVIRLLDRLKDDESLYVRRSVANNLNDIWKDNPQVVIDVAKAWLSNAPKLREQLLRHALRTAIKQGHEEVLALIGYKTASQVLVRQVQFTPTSVQIGQSVEIRFSIENAGPEPQDLLVDLQVGFVKANGTIRNKVFKLSAVHLEKGQTREFRFSLKLHQMTTRTHYAGNHPVSALINGRPYPLGGFEVFGR